MSKKVIHTDGPFTSEERETLRQFANLMIPPSDEYGVPGAGDPQILAAIVDHLAPVRDLVSKGLGAMNEMALEHHSKKVIEISDADKPAVIEAMLGTHGIFLQTIMASVLQHYYQDTRIMASLDMEIRPPFPGGYEVEQGDWSLLDPVRQREPFYRRLP